MAQRSRARARTTYDVTGSPSPIWASRGPRLRTVLLLGGPKPARQGWDEEASAPPALPRTVRSRARAASTAASLGSGHCSPRQAPLPRRPAHAAAPLGRLPQPGALGQLWPLTVHPLPHAAQGTSQTTTQGVFQGFSTWVGGESWISCSVRRPRGARSLRSPLACPPISLCSPYSCCKDFSIPWMRWACSHPRIGALAVFLCLVLAYTAPNPAGVQRWLRGEAFTSKPHLEHLLPP